MMGGLPLLLVPRQSRTIAIACIMVVLVGAVTPAMPESSCPPAYLAPPRLDWSDEKLAAYATVSLRIEAELRTWVARYARSEDPRGRSTLIAENEAVIRDLIDETGLTLLEFDEIRRAAQGAPRLHARIAAIIQRP